MTSVAGRSRSISNWIRTEALERHVEGDAVLLRNGDAPIRDQQAGAGGVGDRLHGLTGLEPAHGRVVDPFTSSVAAPRRTLLT